MAAKFHFECTDCGATFEPAEVSYLCPACEKKNSAKEPPFGVLKTLYPYETLLERFGENVFRELESRHFIDLLPINHLKSLPNLNVGNTPLYHYAVEGQNETAVNLFLKDDSQNPTFSFKDRASALVSAFALENKLETIVAASTGNAGSSLAGICAAQGQKAVILVPANAPKAKLTQIVMYGATIVPVDGTYDDAFDMSIEASCKFGWYNRNTAYNPLTIEGKKTVAFELFAQMNQNIPDRIFVPVGDGVIISGVYKGFEDLLKLEIIHKMPVIVAVQSSGSSNIINNLEKDDFTVTPSHTIADSISVDIPRNFRMAKKFLLQYKGEKLSVSDEEIISASKLLSSKTGLFAEPAAATAYAGFLSYLENNMLEPESTNVVLLTGSGLKDLNTVQPVVHIPGAVKPDIGLIEKFLKKAL